MYSTTARTLALDPFSRSEHVGIVISRSGAVTLGAPFTTDVTATNPTPPPELSKFLVCTVGGNIVYQHSDGQFGYYPSAAAGQLLPIGAVQVVASHTFTNGGNLSTTATGIWWYGGA